MLQSLTALRLLDHILKQQQQATPQVSLKPPDVTHTNDAFEKTEHTTDTRIDTTNLCYIHLTK